MKAKRILYITYDGLTDPLGQSQILPYLTGLAKEGYRFTILSFEKKERYEQLHSHIQQLADTAGIEWVPLSFTSRPPVLSKYYDLLRMKRKAYALQRQKKFDMVHCRSYIAADLGLKLKRRFGVRFFFDMRGFWADEKRDGGAWPDNHPIFRQVYRYYKKKERQYLKEADYVISLTNAGKKEIQTWPGYDAKVPLAVIPCCADMTHFSLTDAAARQEGRKRLHIAADRLVLSYLGSVGAWYMLDEMMGFYRQLLNTYPNALFLIITHTNPALIKESAARLGIDEKALMIREASRQEVPVFIKASDINISFIKPVYSKLSSSPTKLGEVLAMGIPVIVNGGVGDVAEIVQQAQAGEVLYAFDEAAYQQVIESIPAMLRKDPAAIREKITPIYDLAKGIEAYQAAYRQVLGA